MSRIFSLRAGSGSNKVGEGRKTDSAGEDPGIVHSRGWEGCRLRAHVSILFCQMSLKHIPAFLWKKKKNSTSNLHSVEEMGSPQAKQRTRALRTWSVFSETADIHPTGWSPVDSIPIRPLLEPRIGLGMLYLFFSCLFCWLRSLKCLK